MENLKMRRKWVKFGVGTAIAGVSILLSFYFGFDTKPGTYDFSVIVMGAISLAYIVFIVTLFNENKGWKKTIRDVRDVLLDGDPPPV